MTDPKPKTKVLQFHVRLPGSLDIAKCEKLEDAILIGSHYAPGTTVVSVEAGVAIEVWRRRMEDPSFLTMSSAMSAARHSWGALKRQKQELA